VSPFKEPLNWVVVLVLVWAALGLTRIGSGISIAEEL
jgi:hypothetical protein